MKIEENIDLYAVTDKAAEDVNKDFKPKSRRKFAKIFDTISSWLLVIMIFLLPIFASFNPGISDEMAKRVMFTGFVLVSFLLWLLARLEDGVFKIPKSPIILTSGTVVLGALVATIFSPVPLESLIGVGIETGTFASIILGVVSMLLISIYAQNSKVVSRMLVALVASVLVLFLLQLIHNIFGATLFGLFPNSISSLLGKWNDLSLFSGLVLIASVAVLEILSIPRRVKILTIILGVLGFIGLFFTNFVTAWVLVLVILLITFVYKFSLLKRQIDGSLIPSVKSLKSPSFVLIIVSIVLILSSNWLNNGLLRMLQLGNLEVRPSWSSTLDISRSAMSDNVLVGSGLNRFARVWQMHKPKGVNDTVFWGNDFNAGVGSIPTFATTAGLVGIVTWILLLLAILYFGVKSIFTTRHGNAGHAFKYIAFLSTLYLWLTAIFYIPDTALWFLAFIFAGIFIATNAEDSSGGNEEVVLSRNPKISFISVLVSIVLVLITLSGGYLLEQRYRSLYTYQNAVYAYSQSGDVSTAEKSLLKAISIDGSEDLYYRSLVDAKLIQINTLLSQAGSTDSPEILKSRFQGLLSDAIAAGDIATRLNATNYLNWISLARVYESVVPLKIEGADALAEKSYQSALAVYPENPQIYMFLSRLEVAKGDKAKARKYIAESLRQKGNYTEALFALAQMDYADGNIKSAIKNTEQTAMLAPQDIGVFFQLGFLKYLSRDYIGAIAALERARELNPNYSNAKYFLGLSYSALGKTRLATKEFEDILLLNPDNREVKTILSNLKDGRSALSGIGAPANQPEKRPTLPVREESVPKDQ